MAVRKTSTRRTRNPRKRTSRKRIPGSVIFLIFMLVAVITAFFILLPSVRDNMRNSRETAEGQPQEQPPRDSGPTPPVPPAPLPQENEPTEEQPLPPEIPPETTEPEAPVEPPPQPAAPSAETPAQTRNRGIYFMRPEMGGAQLRLTAVSRSLRVSDTPLFDSINALLEGPTAEERNSGLLNYVPPQTRIISAMIRGNTAYLNFSEEFQYNTYGREGCVAQIQQIVWTATEFPNVHDVQFLIDGRRMDFLSEGVMIGSPIGR